MEKDLEMDEDMGFQKREWAFQRIGWAVLGIFVLGALAGFFGPGPASRTQVEQRLLRVDYQRFAHRDAPTPVEVTYRHKQGDTSLVLIFDSGCLANAQLEEARPEPKAVMARHAEGLSFQFDLAPEAEWTKLHFQLRPEKLGRRKCMVRVDEESVPLEFAQYVYP
jgi:hypothetical protein